MAARDEVCRSQLMVDVIEVIVHGGDEHRDLYALVFHDILRQRQGLPVGVELLRWAAWAGEPDGHAENVRVVAMDGLYQLDDPRTIDEA